MIGDELYIVRCAYHMSMGINVWLRIENSFPANFIATVVNPRSGGIRAGKEPIYLCRDCYDKLVQIENADLELPKN